MLISDRDSTIQVVIKLSLVTRSPYFTISSQREHFCPFTSLSATTATLCWGGQSSWSSLTFLLAIQNPYSSGSFSISLQEPVKLILLGLLFPFISVIARKTSLLSHLTSSLGIHPGTPEFLTTPEATPSYPPQTLPLSPLQLQICNHQRSWQLPLLRRFLPPPGSK